MEGKEEERLRLRVCHSISICNAIVMYGAMRKARTEVRGTHHSGYELFHKYVSGFVHFQVTLERSRIGSCKSIGELK